MVVGGQRRELLFETRVILPLQLASTLVRPAFDLDDSGNGERTRVSSGD